MNIMAHLIQELHGRSVLFILPKTRVKWWSVVVPATPEQQTIIDRRTLNNYPAWSPTIDEYDREQLRAETWETKALVMALIALAAAAFSLYVWLSFY